MHFIFRKVWNRIYKKPKTENTPYTFTVKYPKSNAKNNRPINFILVEDPENTESDRIFDDDMVIKHGGINKTDVTLEITTSNQNATKYRVLIFVTPPK